MMGWALVLLAQTVFARPGDTWESLALRLYGSRDYATALRKANPDKSRPSDEIQVPEISAEAKVLVVVGRAQRTPADVPLQPGAFLKEGDTLTLDTLARVVAVFSDGSRVQWEGPGRVVIEKLRRVDPFDLKALIRVIHGAIEVRLRRLAGLSKEVDVVTPSATGGIRGTWTSLRVTDTVTRNMVFRGKVSIQNPAGRVDLPEGTGTLVRSQDPPLPPQPLPPPPTVSPLPRRILLAGASQVPLLLRWKRDHLRDVRLRVLSPEAILMDTLLSSGGTLPISLKPGEYILEWIGRDSLGLESEPLRQHVQILRLP